MPTNAIGYTPIVEQYTDDQKTWKQRTQFGDRTDGAVYKLHDDLRLAIDVALATQRPLLLRGEPGSGKSSLAPYLARNLGAEFLSYVVNSSTTIHDLLWDFDTVRKLSAAQARKAGDPDLDDADYVGHGVLWQAFAPEGADPNPRVVVLIDEIDKADADVPNGLLGALGAGEFWVTPTETKVSVAEGRQVIVVITTNGERELPPAFVRRCVVAEIPAPTADSLVAIAALHVNGPRGRTKGADKALHQAIAERLMAIRGSLDPRRDRLPGVAEYLDAVHACRKLGIDTTSPVWARLEQFTIRKGVEPT